MPKFVLYVGKIMMVLNNLYNFVLRFCCFCKNAVSKTQFADAVFSEIALFMRSRIPSIY